jgi:hypothetical protein
MQVLALSRRAPGVTAEDLAPHAQGEAVVATRLMAQGVIRTAHLCPERPGAVLVMECDSLDEARAHLATLPMVQHGLIAFEVSRMVPYTAWTALFKDEFRS